MPHLRYVSSWEKVAEREGGGEEGGREWGRREGGGKKGRNQSESVLGWGEGEGRV